MNNNHKPKEYKDLFVGLDVKVPTLNGEFRKYVNFDNSASTPTFLSVMKIVNDFLNYYSSVHRGTGFKSQLSTFFTRMHEVKC